MLRLRVIAGLLLTAYAVAAVVAPGTVLPPVVLAAETPPDPVVGPDTVIAEPAPASASDSAITATGKGEFANLQVTVSQTRDLINQVVDITWTGGKPTVGGVGEFVANYLQIMQCWSDDPKGPAPEQCQFGAYYPTDPRGGFWSTHRRITRAGAPFVDASDPLTTAGADSEVPFFSVKGVVAKNLNEFRTQFDQYTTNEIPYTRTAGDGKGVETFEVQTGVEAPALGCGEVVSGTARRCWLVVVPRGETEVDGSGLTAIINSPAHRMDTSPLSATNWSKRIVFPLDFRPLERGCSLTASEVPLLGAESAREAVNRWLPALCANNGPVFGFSKVTDAVAERRLDSDTNSPAMVILNGAIDPTSVKEDRTYVYAPVALSGIAIAVLIQRKPAVCSESQDPRCATEKQLAGRPIETVKLTPRVVAKLLTQSYRYNVSKDAGYLSYPDGKPYPENLTKDPDFLADNPAFAGQAILAKLHVVVPSGNSSAFKLVWEWLMEDQDAADFLAGLPDQWGMRVNPFFQILSQPQEIFPKVDPYCDYTTFIATKGEVKPLCTFDVHPYAADFQEVARSVSRGDTLGRTAIDLTDVKKEWKKDKPELNGLRQLLGVTDTANAERYGLVTAQLRNAAGQFVAPTPAALEAGVAAMRPSAVEGVKLPDPSNKNAAAYPLTMLNYAITAPVKLGAEEAKTYAAFLRFVAGPGQTPGTGPGTLPAGYAPLSAALKAQALAAADQVEARVGPTATTSADATTTASDPSTQATSSAAGTTAGGGTTSAAGSATSAGGSTTPGSSTVALGANGAAVAVGAGGAVAAPSARSAGAAGPASPTAAGAAVPTQVVSPAPSLPVNTTPVGFAAPNPSPSTTEETELAQRLTPTDLVGWVRYVTVVALMLGIAAALLGPALPRLAWRLEGRGATPTGTTAPQEETPQNTDEGTQRAPDDAMAGSV